MELAEPVVPCNTSTGCPLGSPPGGASGPVRSSAAGGGVSNAETYVYPPKPSMRLINDTIAFSAREFRPAATQVGVMHRVLVYRTEAEAAIAALVNPVLEWVSTRRNPAFFDGRPEQYIPPADARLNQPEDVAQAVLFALCQPPGCEARELVVCPSEEPSWP